MNYLCGERANSRGHKKRQSREREKYAKIKKGAKRSVLLLELLKYGRVSSKEWREAYKGKRSTSEASLTHALNSIPESIAPYEYKEGTTVYVDCLRRERIQDLLDAWYAEEEKRNE